MKDGASLLENYKIHVVPFIDLDGVEEGDQGKARAPHDHNRDYIASPLYAATAAWMEYGEKNPPEIYIDFHCPWKWAEREEIASQRNNRPFFLKRSSPLKEEIEKLGVILGGITRGNLNGSNVTYESTLDISMGEDWFQPGTPNSCSFFERLGAKISATLEYPYFGKEEMVVTQQNSKKFGADLGKSLDEYVKMVYP